MASKKTKLTKADLKRIEDLHKKVVADKVSVAKEKIALKKMRKEIDAEKKKVAGQWKELKNAKKQAQLGHDFKSNVAAKNASKASKNSGDSPNLKRLQEQLLEMKTKLNHESKRARQHKMEVDQLRAENKVLQKKLKNLQGRKGKGEDPRIKHLKHENKMLKKQLKLLMIELNKKRRWFQRCIKSFKNNRSKWIRNQESALKKKGVLIKYVFLDDVKQIKQYRAKAAKGGKNSKGKVRFKNIIKVKSRDGGVIVLKDVDIVVLDADDADNDSSANSKTKSKKSKGDQLDEMEQYLAQIEQEIEEDQLALGAGDDQKSSNDVDADGNDIDGDDIDSDGEFDMSEDAGDLEGDFASSADADGNGLDGNAVSESIDGGDTAALSAQMVWLKKELVDRTDDIEALREMVSDAQSHPDPSATVHNLVTAMQQRGEEMAAKLETELYAKSADVAEVRAGNARWALWFSSLARAVAKNGAVFGGLLGVYDAFLEELKGRLSDVDAVNAHFYCDKRDNSDHSVHSENGNENENENVAEADAVDGQSTEQKDVDAGDGVDDSVSKEKSEESESAEVSVLSALRESVSARHSEITRQFAVFAEREAETAADEAASEAEAVDESFGADDARKAALDANEESVRRVREALSGNNGEWRQLLRTVSSDYARMEGQRLSLVEGIADSQRELKAFIDLVAHIPKRTIAGVEAAGADVDVDDAEEEDDDGQGVEKEEEVGDEQPQEPQEDGAADADCGDGDDE